MGLLAISIVSLLITILLMSLYVPERFAPIMQNDDAYRYLYTHTMFPFWNTQIGSKRNMSYDLRGDAPIPIVTTFPFNQSSTFPIRNKPLFMVT